MQPLLNGDSFLGLLLFELSEELFIVGIVDGSDRGLMLYFCLQESLVQVLGSLFPQLLEFLVIVQ